MNVVYLSLDDKWRLKLNFHGMGVLLKFIMTQMTAFWLYLELFLFSAPIRIHWGKNHIGPSNSLKQLAIWDQGGGDEGEMRGIFFPISNSKANLVGWFELLSSGCIIL